uniref:Bile salt export pump n=1 Tax=Capitella teleta TaxID=283909 RepID=X2B039_CAPTE
MGTICALGHGAAMPGLMVIFGKMTDSFIFDNPACDPNSTDNQNSTMDQNASMWLMKEMFEKMVDDMASYAIWYVVAGVAVIVLAYGQVTFWLLTSYRQTQKLRVELFNAVLRQEVGWFDTHEIGELNNRLTDDVNKVKEGIGDKIGNFWQWIATFFAGIIIGFVYGWKLALVIFAVSPLLAISGGIMAFFVTSATNNELTAYAKAGAVAEEVLGAIRTVVAFVGQEKECKRYFSNLDDAKKAGVKKGAIGGGGMGVIFFIIFSCYALAFWYGSKLVREEEAYTPGVMLIVRLPISNIFFSVVFGAFGIGNAAPNLQNLATARSAAYTLWDLIDRKSLIDSSSTQGEKPDRMLGNIEFKDVHFKYPSRPDVKVLNGFSMKASVGQTVALVGSSGCGKSTTVQMIQRFYDPEEGGVLIDGIDVRKLNIGWLRSNMGVVSQEPVLFGTTIKENIRYGREGVTDEEIINATKHANAFDFIMKLPKQLETLVGERGAQLSGGQKQRIAIARALVRDPKILLLDEATSALDTESESTVQSALDTARMGRTTIVVAHRLSTIRNADLIYGVKDGVVQESGSHEELMEKQGIYYQLVTNQVTQDEAEEVQTSHIIITSQNHNTENKFQKLPEPSFARIMRLNAPEWYYIIGGCLGATVSGAIQPAFAVIFSEILGALFFTLSGERLTKRVRQLTFRAMLRQEIGYFDLDKNNVGALTTRLSTEASAVQGATGTRLGTAFQSMASVGAGIVIGFVYSWKLTLLILGFLPFLVVGGILQMKVMQGYSGKGQEALEGAGKIAIEAIENIRTVASLTREKTFSQDYERLTRKPFKDSMKNAHLLGFTFSFTMSIMFFAHAAIFSLGAHLIKEDGLSFADMFKVFGSIVFGAMAIGQASHFAPDYGKGKAAAARLFALLDREPEIDSFSTEGQKPSACKGVVEFKDVKFSYPTRSTVPVLRGLDLEVLMGKTVALVGSSGCGKSTSVQMMERFYDPAEGTVLVDGMDVRNLNISWLRSQIGIVSQEPVLFDCSIRENIAYGDNSRQVPMVEIIEAARNANIHTFIESLPEVIHEYSGYETNVGNKGTQLSGGQKQRVAIARALIRNPKILLLDEATSALDTESEKVVQEALDRAQEGRTSIVIAHRLSTIQNADLIVVIHNGRVAEQGSHAELIALRGIYHKLSNTHAK